MVSKMYQVTLPLYFILLAVASLWAYIAERKESKRKRKLCSLNVHDATSNGYAIVIRFS